MKKTVYFLLCFVLATGLCGCSDNGVNKTGKISVVTTTFPTYDWVREIVADNENVDIIMLLDSGTDLHSFQPTADDIIEIANCDMFIYVGGESDKWIDGVLKEKQNEGMVTVNLMKLLGGSKKFEQVKQGMETQEEDEAEYDEHIWLSIKNAELFCSAICDKLCEIDKSGAEGYKKNASNYIAELKELDEDYTFAVNNAAKKTLIFADRFPFIYLTDDYGIDYFAAFAGCSAESEASFETVVFLANKVDELKLDSIIKIEGSDTRLANTIKDNTKGKNAQILTLNSMQSVTSSQVDEGVTYLKICKENLEVLKRALG